MRIGIGLSRVSDSARAALEAIRKAKQGAPKPQLAFVYGSIHHDQSKLYAAITSELDATTILGGSSYAEISGVGVTRRSVVVLLLDFGPGAAVRFATAPENMEPYAIGKAFAEAVKAPAAEKELLLGLLAVGTFTNREDEIAVALAEHLGRVPIFGGRTCGDYDLGFSHPDFWANYQYLDSLTNQAARLALVSLPKDRYELAFAFEHGWPTIGPVHTLTRAEGDRIYEVDGQPILDFYRQFLGSGHSDHFFEQMIQRYGFAVELDENRDTSLFKVPVSCNVSEGYISVSPASDMQGKRANLIQATRRTAAEGARAAALRCHSALGGVRPALVFMVSCCTRAALLHSKANLELDAVQGVFGKDVPLFGYYSGGEFAPCQSRYADILDPNNPAPRSFYHATTVCLMAIGCRGPVTAVLPTARDATPPEDKDAEIARLTSMLAKSEHVQDDSESFLSNFSRKSYDDSERLRKQTEIIHRYTPHDVWRQVGDTVDRGEKELTDAEFNGSFMFMDVKGFTSYSEEHGSAEVVKALNEIFAPATDTIYECGGDVDKFIGDCIFAAFREGSDAVEAARRIIALFEELRSRGNPFTVRIGINTGRAVRANVGATKRKEYTYIGDAVNVAQRLEANCTPGRLLAAVSLEPHLAGRFKSIDRREVALKGKKAPVVALECSL